MKLFLTLLLALVSTNALSATLLSSTLLGSGNPSSYEEEAITGFATDKSGFRYLVGFTPSTGFPVTIHYGETNFGYSCFVVKLSPDATRIIYSTVLSYSRGRAIAVDAAGQAYVTGEALYHFFPSPGGTNLIQLGDSDAFVAKLDADGKLVASSLFGGDDLEIGLGITLDAAGNVLVAGFTSSTNFPTTANAGQKILGGDHDGFVLKLRPDTLAPLFSSYFGGTGRESISKIASSSTNGIYIAGRTSSKQVQGMAATQLGPGGATDGFLANLDPNTGALKTWTLLGGSDADIISGLAFDKSGAPLVSGITRSLDFPTSPNAAKTNLTDSADAFITKLAPNLKSILFSSFIGGEESEDDSLGLYLNEAVNNFTINASSLDLDGTGNIYISGNSSSTSFGDGVPKTTLGGANNAGYVVKIAPDGTRVNEVTAIGSGSYTRVLGLAVTGTNRVIAFGSTSFANRLPFFPVTPSALQPEYGGSVSDAFLTEVLFEQRIPSNDNRTNAAEIKGTTLTIAADNFLASAEPQEPTHAGAPASHSIWWKWTAPITGKLILSTEGSGFDTALSFYNTNMVSLAENDDAVEGSTYSRLKSPVTKGTTYLIALDGKSGATGQCVLSLMLSATPNDDFTNSIAITNYPALITASNAYSTAEPGEPMHANPGHNSVWWRWTSPVTEGVIVDTMDSSFPTGLGVYTGTNLATLKTTSEAFGYPFAKTVFFAEKGSNYWIAVDSRLGATGAFSLSIQRALPPANNEFTNATPLTGFVVDTQGNNLTARVKLEEAALFKEPSAAGRTIWWSWTCPTNGWVDINTFGGDGDPNLVIFTGSNIANLSPVADNDNGYRLPGNNQARVVFRVTQGVTYFIRADTSIYGPPGIIQLHLRLTQPPELLGTGARLTSAGKLEFDAKGVAGHDYTLQTSSNLKDWTDYPTPALSGASFKISVPWQISSNAFFRLLDKTTP